jgi:hypothetical protein
VTTVGLGPRLLAIANGRNGTYPTRSRPSFGAFPV